MVDQLSGLWDAVAAVRITSPMSFSWLGSPAYAIPRRLADALSTQASAIHMTSALTHHLYLHYYLPGRAVPGSRVSGGSSPAAAGPKSAGFIDIASTQQWQRGWTVRAVRGRHVAVARHDLTLWLDHERCAPSDGDLVAGARTAVRSTRTRRA